MQPSVDGGSQADSVTRRATALYEGHRDNGYRRTDQLFACLLIGEWVAEGPHASAEISCSWGKDESYIVTQLKMRPAVGEPFSATQVIGWDPSQQKIRSFMFDSRGAFNEGQWINEGDGWVVRSTESHPNGKRTASTKIYSRIDDNTAIWESIT